MDCEQLLVDLTSLCDSNITCRWGGKWICRRPAGNRALQLIHCRLVGRQWM